MSIGAQAAIILTAAEKELVITNIINYDVGKELTRLYPEFPNLNRRIITECVNVVNSITPNDPTIEQTVYYLVQAFNYYIETYDSSLKDNIKHNNTSLAGLSDTLRIIYSRRRIHKEDETNVASVDALVVGNKLPTQTGGQKIRKYRKTRTNPSKSNIRNKRRTTRRRHRRRRVVA